MSSRQEDKIIDGVQSFLEDGEEVQGAIVARPRGWTQAMAGSLNLGAHQQGKAREGAKAAGFQLASPMALVLTQRRLLSFEIGSPIGMGKDSRGVDLESVDDLDERQLVSWMKQAAALPGFGKR